MYVGHHRTPCEQVSREMKKTFAAILNSTIWTDEHRVKHSFEFELFTELHAELSQNGGMNVRRDILSGSLLEMWLFFEREARLIKRRKRII